MTERVPCIIPGCRHTCRKLWAGHEWLCGDHWRLVPRALRHRRQCVRAALRRRSEVLRDMVSGQMVAKTARAHRLEVVIWARMKRLALERAAGI